MAKCILSSTTQATIEVDSLKDSNDYATTITRAKFEELCMGYFKECIPPVEKVLKDS
jgi:heat shock protein 1/8